MGYPRLHRLSLRGAGPRSLALALCALACSVYELPSISKPGLDGGGSEASAGMPSGGSEAGQPGNGGAGGGTSGGGGGAPSRAGAGGALFDPMGGEGGAQGVVDECPADPDKLAPGDCGCGVPDAPSATSADCDTLESLLSHRYDFEGTGTVVTDRVGNAHGTIARGATLSKLGGKGVVLLGGGADGAYVDLPNRLLSPLTNATLETWVTWGGGSPWQRIFDFGDTDDPSPEDNPGDGRSYLFLSPCSSLGTAFVGYSLAGNAVGKEVELHGDVALAQSLSHVVVVADDAGDELRLYVNGKAAGVQAWTGSLSAINDVNVWLGRSQFDGDATLGAVFHEFRIYTAALNAEQVSASFNAGPDPEFLAD